MKIIQFKQFMFIFSLFFFMFFVVKLCYLYNTYNFNSNIYSRYIMHITILFIFLKILLYKKLGSYCVIQCILVYFIIYYRSLSKLVVPVIDVFHSMSSMINNCKIKMNCIEIAKNMFHSCEFCLSIHVFYNIIDMNYI